MSELVEDAVASCCGDIGGHFVLIRNELLKFVELKFQFFSFDLFDVSDILATSYTAEAKMQLFIFLKGLALVFCFSGT